MTGCSRKDAHGVYRACGFTPLQFPDWFMEITLPDPYGPACKE